MMCHTHPQTHTQCEFAKSCSMQLFLWAAIKDVEASSGKYKSLFECSLFPIFFPLLFKYLTHAYCRPKSLASDTAAY